MTENIIAIIKTNDFLFSKEKHYLQKENLSEDISKFIEFKKTPNTDLMENIINSIQLTPDLIGDSQICFETINNVYQICFVYNENNDNVNNESTNNNNFASYLIGEKLIGNCVLINSKVSEDNNTCEPDTIDLETITNIIYKKFVHKGIFVSSNENESIVEFDYFNNPLEFYNCSEEEYNKFKIIETPFLKFSISAYIEINSENLDDKINKRATKILGTYKVKGNIILIVKTPNEFNDFDKEIYKKIYILASNSLNTRTIKPEENKEDVKINDLQVVFNRYHLLEKRLTEFQNSCSSCKKIFENENILTCTGCYRAKYDSLQCQKNDWDIHKKECLYNKEFIN